MMRKVLTLRTLSAALVAATAAATVPAMAVAEPDASSAAAPATASAPAAPAPATNGTIVEVAAANPAFSTLVTAVTAADLAGALSGTGPFTVFAPTNDAFGKLPAGTVETLVKPENKRALTGVLTYHVVAGAIKAADLIGQIQAGGGTATLTTLSGGTLTASIDGDSVMLTDAKGGKARVIMADVTASNGVIHAIDTLVMP